MRRATEDPARLGGREEGEGAERGPARHRQDLGRRGRVGLAGQPRAQPVVTRLRHGHGVGHLGRPGQGGENGPAALLAHDRPFRAQVPICRVGEAVTPRQNREHLEACVLVRTASVMSSERSSMRAHNGCVTGVDRGSPKSGTKAADPTTAARTSVFSLPHMGPSTRLRVRRGPVVPAIVDHREGPGGCFSDGPRRWPGPDGWAVDNR